MKQTHEMSTAELERFQRKLQRASDRQREPRKRKDPSRLPEHLTWAPCDRPLSPAERAFLRKDTDDGA